MATANNASLTALDAVVKKLYDDRKVADLTFSRHPLFGWVPKKTGIVGKSFEIPVTTSTIAGGSSDFATAVTNRKASAHERWSVTRTSSYQTATIENEAIRAMSTDKGAFLRGVASQLDSAYSAFATDTAFALFGDGVGVRGTVSSVTNTVVTFATSLEARAFEIGMRCTIYDSTDATLAGTANATNVRVTAVSRAAKTVTFDTDLDTVAGTVVAAVATGDFIVRAGDENAKVTGLDGWLTGTSTLFGVDRSAYPERLSGLAYDSTTEAHDVALRKAAATALENEGRPGACFMHPTEVAVLDTTLDGNTRFDKVASTDASIGFDSIKVHAGGLVLDVMADSWCALTKAYLLEKDSMCLFSIDRCPDFVSQDGNTLHRLEGEDAVEFRIGAYFNLAVNKPGHNVIVSNLG